MRKRYLTPFTVLMATIAVVTLRATADPLPTDHVTPQYMFADPSAGLTVYGGTSGNHGTVAGGYMHQVTQGGVSGDTFPTNTSGINDFTATGKLSQLFCIDLVDNTSPGWSDRYLVENLANAPRPWGTTVDNQPMMSTRAAWLGLLAANYWTNGGGYLGNESTYNGDPNGGTNGGIDPLGALPGYTPISTTNPNDNTRYAALQVAIWEIIFEGANATTLPMTGSAVDWDLTNVPGSDLYTNNALVNAEANRILNNIERLVTQTPGGLLNTRRQVLYALTNEDGNPSRQDMVIRTQSYVPEPSGLVLAGLGLVGLLSRRRKRA